jgi:hypothetical protein
MADFLRDEGAKPFDTSEWPFALALDDPPSDRIFVKRLRFEDGGWPSDEPGCPTVLCCAGVSPLLNWAHSIIPVPIPLLSDISGDVRRRRRREATGETEESTPGPRW